MARILVGVVLLLALFPLSSCRFGGAGVSNASGGAGSPFSKVDGGLDEANTYTVDVQLLETEGGDPITDVDAQCFFIDYKAFMEVAEESTPGIRRGYAPRLYYVDRSTDSEGRFSIAFSKEELRLDEAESAVGFLDYSIVRCELYRKSIPPWIVSGDLVPHGVYDFQFQAFYPDHSEAADFSEQTKQDFAEWSEESRVQDLQLTWDEDIAKYKPVESWPDWMNE